MAEWEKDSKMLAFLGMMMLDRCYYGPAINDELYSLSLIAAGSAVSPKNESSVSPAAQGVELSPVLPAPTFRLSSRESELNYF